MRNVTLGGERLGSGKKMQVGLSGFERSTHDLGYVWRSTMSAGTLVPFMTEVALPGDTFDIDLNADVMTAPTTGPLFGSFKVQLDVFLVPMRLYNSLLHNNMLGIGNDMKRVKIPTLTLIADPVNENNDADNAQINPSCILNYLGIRGIGFNGSSEEVERKFNAIPLLAYWDIYGQYYAAKNEKVGAVISPSLDYVESVTEVLFTTDNGNNSYGIPQFGASNNFIDFTQDALISIKYNITPPDLNTIMFDLAGKGLVSYKELVVSSIDNGSDTISGYYNFSKFGLTHAIYWQYIDNNILTVEPKITFFDLENINTMRKNILAFSSEVMPYSVNSYNNSPYNVSLTKTGNSWRRLTSQCGLGVKTYQSDIFNNWLDTTWIGNINSASAISTLSGSFTMDQINFSKKVYEMLNRIAISGGSYNDWLDAQYDHERTRIPESPMYMGGLIKELVFQEVVSTAATATEALGSLAGRGKLSPKHKGGKIIIKVDEPSYIIGIASLTPRIDYSQGNKWDVNLETLNDLHVPSLDEIGFQDLITEQMAYFGTYWNGVKWIKTSAGKQPAWLNYMTNYNRCYGNFAIDGNQMYMTLNRRYELDTNSSTLIKDLTSYIDPKKFNNIFPVTSLDAQNFWMQIGVDITARRKMSAKIIPNL